MYTLEFRINEQVVYQKNLKKTKKQFYKFISFQEIFPHRYTFLFIPIFLLNFRKFPIYTFIQNCCLFGTLEYSSVYICTSFDNLNMVHFKMFIILALIYFLILRIHCEFFIGKVPYATTELYRYIL